MENVSSCIKPKRAFVSRPRRSQKDENVREERKGQEPVYPVERLASRYRCQITSESAAQSGTGECPFWRGRGPAEPYDGVGSLIERRGGSRRRNIWMPIASSCRALGRGIQSMSPERGGRPLKGPLGQPGDRMVALLAPRHNPPVGRVSFCCEERGRSEPGPALVLRSHRPLS